MIHYLSDIPLPDSNCCFMILNPINMERRIRNLPLQSYIYTVLDSDTPKINAPLSYGNKSNCGKKIGSKLRNHVQLEMTEG